MHAHAHIHTMEYYFSHNKGNLTICNNMNGPRRFILSEISRELHRPHAYFHTNSKNQSKTKQNENRPTDTENKRVVAVGRVVGGGLNG